MKCDICPRNCDLKNGMRGACGARIERNGRIEEDVHGMLSAIHVDPIEKKPLHHYFPGCGALSIGSFGCNLMCKGCQNASISRARPEGGFFLSPERIAQEAIRHHCPVVAYTYNEPIVWGEFVAETAKAVHDAGLKNVMVTAGYVTASTREWLFKDIDAANVDLKGFTEEFYRTWANGELAPILDTLEYLHSLPNFWLEITTLLIPGINDDMPTLEREFTWIVEHLGCDVPVHLSAFHPAHRALEIENTPVQTIENACKLAREAGIRYVYPGNVSLSSHTICPTCGEILIRRNGYRTECSGMNAGCCKRCGTIIAGKF